MCATRTACSHPQSFCWGLWLEDFRVWGYMGIMEEKMETIGILQGLYRDIKAILGL